MAKEEQIKTSIDLTGEKEYRAACTNINSSLREIGSEMKLTTAEFADNADSVEALTAKQKLLQKQFDEQAKKAEAAEKALKKMRDNGIEPTNPAYQKMQTNLNNTKADMVKIQKEIDDTSKKLKSSKVDWESVGETVGKAGKAIEARRRTRRLTIRVKAEDGTKYLAHTLNNTVVAPPRMLIAFLENNLQADGSVRIPEVLQPYMGGMKEIRKK